MNTILENVEQILDGIEVEVIDMPVDDLPDTEDGGSNGSC